MRTSGSWTTSSPARSAATATKARKTPRSRLPGRERIGALATRLNLPLVAIVLASFAFTVWYTAKVSEWSVMTDELLYVKLALGVGDSLSPLPQVHGEDFAVFSQLYPLLTAPFFHFLDMPTAFRVVHVLNAAMMATAAIPAYLLTREVVSYRPAAYFAAAISVAVPWMTMSTMVLTDVVAYPVFVWAMLAIQRAIASPSPRRDIVALTAIALAFFARTQFVVLALVLPLAVAVHEIGYGALQRPRPPLRDAVRIGLRNAFNGHRVLAIALAAALVLALPLALLGVATEVLGNYEAATERSLVPDGVVEAMLEHLDFVVVATGIVPFVLGVAWAVDSVLRPSGKAGHAYAVLSLLTIATLVFQVSSFDLNFPGGYIRDRYLSYVAPLLAVAMVACLGGSRRPWRAVLLTGLLLAAVIWVPDYSPRVGPYFDSPTTAFLPVIDGRAYELGQLISIDLEPGTALVAAAILLSLVMALAVRRAPRTVLFWVTALAVLGFCVGETRYVFGRMVLGTGGARSISGNSIEGRDWVDEAVPGDRSVGLLPVPVTLLPGPERPGARPEFINEYRELWWNTEAWNKSIDRAYSYLGATTYTPFPRTPLSLDRSSGVLEPADRSEYVLVASSDPRFRLEGHVVARSDALELIRPGPRWRASWASRRIGADGWTRPGARATVRIFGAPGRVAGRRVSLTLTSPGDLDRPRAYLLTSAAGRRAGSLRADATRTETLDVCIPKRGFADLRIRVPEKTRLADDRLVGLRVVQVTTQRSATACLVAGR